MELDKYGRKKREEDKIIKYIKEAIETAVFL